MRSLRWIGAVAVLAVACGPAPEGTVTPTHAGKPAPGSSLPSYNRLLALTRGIRCPPPRPSVPAASVSAFRAIATVSCAQDVRVLPGQGQWLVAVRRVATGGTTALQRAYELPDERLGGACAAVLVFTPPVVFVSASGRTLAPAAPHDSCGQPRSEVLTAYRTATWREVSVRRLRLVVSLRAMSAKCEMRWKNENWIGTEFGAHRSKGGPVFRAVPATLHVCLYRVTGADLEVGDFTRGFDLSSADSRAVARALEGAGPAGPCPAQRRFAVISTPDGIFANVELGGCWRVQRPYPDNGVGAADATVVTRVLQRH